MTRMRRVLPVCRFVVLLLFLLPLSVDIAAHDLPDDLKVRLMVKPEDGHLHVIARVPLALLEGVALPKRGADLLDLANVDDVAASHARGRPNLRLFRGP